MLIVKIKKCRKNKDDNQFHILISYQHFLPHGLSVHILAAFLHVCGSGDVFLVMEKGKSPR